MDGWENARESFQICSILSSLIHLPSFHSDFQLHTVVFTFDLSSYRLNKSPARRSESCWPVRMCYTNKVWLIDKVFHVRVVLLLLRNVGYFMTCGVKEDSYLPDTLYICSHKAARLQHLCIRVCVCVCVMISVPVGRPGCSRIYRRCGRYSNVYLKQHVPERPRIHLHSSSSSPSFSLTPLHCHLVLLLLHLCCICWSSTPHTVLTKAKGSLDL